MGNDDWVIEETNFCLGRTANIRFRETDDMARRVKRILEHQTCYMHTRLRDGTVIPFSSYGIMGIMERPIAAETHLEQAVIKWCWDQCYDEAFDDAPVPMPEQSGK